MKLKTKKDFRIFQDLISIKGLIEMHTKNLWLVLKINNKAHKSNLNNIKY